MGIQKIIVRKKIVYWMDFWDDLIENYGKNFYGINLINPHLIIRNIINEIEFNKLKNKINTKYFKDQIEFFIRKDTVIRNKCKSDFVVLSKNLYQETNTYLYQFCNEILKYFKNGMYFKESLKIMIGILTNSIWNEKQKESLKYWNQSLITEYLIKGYNLKGIRNFPKNIFDEYKMQNEYLLTNYPHEVKTSEFYKGNVFDRKAYNNEIIKIINSLSVKDRLYTLEKLFFKQAKECYFIFQIQGLKGGVDFNIGDVNFYNPEKKKYISKPDERYTSNMNREYFGSSIGMSFLNAAVKVDYFDIESSKLEALKKIEKSLDLINLFLNPRTDLKIFKERCLIADGKGKEIGASYKISEDHLGYKYFNSQEIRTELLKTTMGTIIKTTGKKSFISSSNNTNDIEKKIIDSLHWNRKAKETNNIEDMLLNYWVSIENFLDFGNSSKFDNAIKFVPAICTFNFIYSIGWDLFYYINNLINFVIKLDDDIKEKCNLDPKPFTRYSLKPFINNLDLLLDQIDGEIIKDKILFVKSFYEKNDFAKDKILDQLDKMKNDVLLIYRFRNQIVHNAHFDNRILPYYIQKAKLYSTILLKTIIEKYVDKKIDNIEQILTNSFLRFDRMISKLKCDEKIDFFNLQL